MKKDKLSFHEEIDVGEPTISHKTSFDFSKVHIKNKCILDVGCWTGGFEYFLNDFSCIPVAIEKELDALKVAKKNNPNVEFIQASVFNLPFKNNSFDVVTMWLVMEHLPKSSEHESLVEINRILKKNLILILSTPHSHWLNNILDPAYYLTGHRHYEKTELIKMFNTSGFNVESIQCKGGFFYASSVIFFYIFKHIFKSKLPRLKIVERQIEKEHEGKGFADIYVMATRKVCR